MSLDPHTLLVVNVVNLLGLAVLLPLIMGRTLSPAAKAARYSLIIHAFAWISVIISEQCASYWLNLLFSGISMICYSGCNCLLFKALSSWLGPRRWWRTLQVLAVAMPVGYVLLFSSYPWRVGWANFLIAGQVAILASAVLHSQTAIAGRWRYALFVCFSMMTIFTAWRGVLGAFFTEAYSSFAAPHPINVLSLLVANLTMVLSNVCLLVAWREEAEQKLESLAITDPLTELLNRRGWCERAEPTLSRALLQQQPLTLFSIDLDHFKAINDQYGHDVGDKALRIFADSLRALQRPQDVLARVGGEEFCILLPGTNVKEARLFDQQLREHVLSAAINALGIALKYSAGLACLTTGDSTLHQLLRRSDEALYQAKHAGRAQLVVNGVVDEL